MKTKKIQTKNVNDKNQQGAALVLSIFAILLVTIIAFAVISNGLVSQNVSTNAKDQTEAYYISEAGLAHAVGLFKANGNSFDVNTVIPASGNGVAFGGGSYTVQTEYDSTTSLRKITSIGTGKNGAVATIEGSYQTGGAPSSPAVLVNGNVSISSNLQVTGTNGIVHVNGTLTLNGNMRAQRYFSSTSTITKTGVQSCPSGAVTGVSPACDAVADTRQSQSVITIPDIQPSSFYSQADYFLVPPNPGSMPTPLSAITPPTTATIYDKNGNILGSNCQAAACWGNWTYSSGSGFTAGASTTFPAGVYYFYHSSMQAKFSTVGSSGSQRSISLIADGHILLDDSTFYFDAKATMGGEKYFVVVGGDIEIDDADLYNTDTNQIFYARNQFFMGDSDAHLYGKVRVLNAANTLYGTNLVTGQAFQVSGPQPIVSNGPSSSSGSGFTLASWREVRY